jgi:uncharacterized RDD family membrane protein YckC
MAMLYEVLPMFAICFLATLPVLPLMPDDHVPAGAIWFQLWLLFVLFGYFAVGWVVGGQSLGMRPWRLRVERQDGGNIGWGDATARFLVGLMGWLCLGIGHWWMFIDAEGRNWPDMATGTRVVRLT